MIKNLKEYKDLKIVAKEVEELPEIIKQLNNCIDALKSHSKHIPIMESISILHNSRTLFEIKLDKLKK
jgi:hypothetical protein